LIAYIASIPIPTFARLLSFPSLDSIFVSSSPLTLAPLAFFLLLQPKALPIAPYSHTTATISITVRISPLPF